MRQDMVAHMEELRVCRATDIRLRTLKRRVTLLVSVLSTRPPPTPRVVDLYSLDSIRTLLDKPLDGGDDTVTVEEFSVALAEMGTVTAHCRAHGRRQLLEVLYNSNDPPPGAPSESSFDLATTLFRCRDNGTHHLLNCTERPLNARDMIVHDRCRTHLYQEIPHPVKWDWVVRDPQEQLALVAAWVKGAGGSGRATLDKEARARATHVVQLAGLDPNVATFQDMDAADAWFVCKTGGNGCPACPYYVGGPTRQVLNWRQAVRTRFTPNISLARSFLAVCQTAHHKAPANGVYRLETEKEVEARSVAALLKWTKKYHESSHANCAHCSSTHMRAQALRDHCRDMYASSVLPKTYI
jgi:hypothetical protein